MFPLLPQRHSIRTRLVLWNTLTLALLFVLMDVLLHYSVRAILTRAIDNQLYLQTQHIVDFPPPELRDEGSGEIEPQMHFPDGRPDSSRDPQNLQRDVRYRPRLISPQGKVLKPPDVLAPWDVAALPAAFTGQAAYSTIIDQGEPIRILSRRFPGQGKVLGVVQAPRSLADTELIISTLDKALLLIFPFTLVCAALGSTLVTNRMLNQVKSFTASANELTAHDLSRRLPVTGNDEFSTLASTFNAMVERLEADFKKREDLIGHLRQMVEQQRRFTADASHELQTPLTAIKANTSLFLSAPHEESNAAESRPMWEDIDQAATAMTHLVEDLLLLARSDEGQLGQNRQVFQLHEAIENAVALAASGKVDIASIQMKLPPEPMPIHANEAELTRLFANLLSNAIRYTPEQGHIVIRAERVAHQARVTVADTGIGIAKDSLPHLGERFFRADTARSRTAGGTGLGLSICKSIVASHGGSLHFESTLGMGTTATVLLPFEAANPQNIPR